MLQYLKEVVSRRGDYKIIKFSKGQILEIQDGVIELLKLKSANQLRDKFEGVAFLDNYSTSLLGELAIEKLLLIKYPNKKTFLKRRYPELKIEGKKFALVTSKYGNFPYVQKDESRPIIFCIRKNEQTIWICGIATQEIFKENTLKSSRMEDLYKDEVQFFGFQKLIPFSTIEDIKEIIIKHGI